MSVQIKGKCKYCGKEYGKGYMHRHLSSCKDRAFALNEETGDKKCGYIELLIYDKYTNQYWLIIEIREDATLKDPDQFIRDIWVECCGHLSSFDIKGQRYETAPMADFFWGKPAKNMNHKLSTVLQDGMRIGYEYDFGSTTDLIIEVKGHRIGIRRKEKVVLLSRNNPHVWTCDICKKHPAEYVDLEKYYEEGIGLLCEECSEDPDNDSEFLSVVCNSPRMGVCGYEGSEKYPDEFVPDKYES